MAWINIIAAHNGRGLSRDIQLIDEALKALGHDVVLSSHQDGKFRGILYGLSRRVRMEWMSLYSGLPRRYDLNIMLEHVSPAYLGLARRNAFIPNPEWLRKRDARWLDRFDAVFTKTDEATRCMRGLAGDRVLKIGFISLDRNMPNVPWKSGFLHLAGASPMKGTERLLQIWRRHPEWPELLLVQSGKEEEGRVDPPNVQRKMGFMSADEVTELQNRYRFHICLSETEGWGHYIAEAMSCGAVVVTCDAPPMNELVSPQRGLLVTAEPSGTLNCATLYAFDETSLGDALARAMAMTEAEAEDMGRRARAWFLENNDGFRARMACALEMVL